MYNTLQYRRLVEYFQSKGDQHPSDEIIAALCPQGRGKSTVYRLLSRMAQTGELRRFHQGKRIFYQYVHRHEDCDGHFHLKCKGCGRLIHLECSQMAEVAAHVSEQHHFQLDMRETVMYGLCAGCNEEKG